MQKNHLYKALQTLKSTVQYTRHLPSLTTHQQVTTLEFSEDTGFLFNNVRGYFPQGEEEALLLSQCSTFNLLKFNIITSIYLSVQV